MRHQRLPVPSPSVIHQNVAEGAVLLLPEDETYFGLNEVGTVIWSLLPPVSETFAELCDSLVARYPDVDRDVIEADAAELLDELCAQKLVHPR